MAGYFGVAYPPHGAASPAPLTNGGGGGGGDGGVGDGRPVAGSDAHWQASAMYPPSSHTPTLSTASINAAAYSMPPPFYAAQTPTRSYAPAPIPAAYSLPPIQAPQPRGPPRPSDLPPSPFQSPAGHHGAHRQVSPITVKPPPSNSHALLPLTIQLRSGTGKKKIWAQPHGDVLAVVVVQPAAVPRRQPVHVRGRLRRGRVHAQRRPPQRGEGHRRLPGGGLGRRG